MGSTVQVILAEDVPNLGHLGDVVTVKRGYARNYLLPKRLAVVATDRNQKELEHHRRVLQQKLAKRIEEAKSLAEKLDGVSLTIPRKVAEDEKLYGSVSERDIQKALAEEGIQVETRHIILERHIKNIGMFDVPIRLAKGVEVTIKVWVVPEDTEVEV